MPISTIGQNGLQQSRILTAVQQPAGAVLQVVQATSGSIVSSSSSTYADSGITATITPSSTSSKVLVFVSLAGVGKSAASASNSIDLQLVRNSTSIFQYEALLGYSNTAIVQTSSSSTTYLDSPATTSATTYKVQFAADGNTASVFINNSNNRLSNSSITLMEIAA